MQINDTKLASACSNTLLPEQTKTNPGRSQRGHEGERPPGMQNVFVSDEMQLTFISQRHSIKFLYSPVWWGRPSLVAFVCIPKHNSEYFTIRIKFTALVHLFLR